MPTKQERDLRTHKSFKHIHKFFLIGTMEVKIGSGRLSTSAENCLEPQMELQKLWDGVTHFSCSSWCPRNLTELEKFDKEEWVEILKQELKDSIDITSIYRVWGLLHFKS